jgi:transposase
MTGIADLSGSLPEAAMSLRPTPVPPVPEATAQLARAVFPRGHLYLTMRDAFEPFFTDEQFAPLFSLCGPPATTPWRLALVLILQFAEGLSDVQAAEAVRDRIAWKYLLGLELNDPGFDPTVLCEFRARLVAGSAEQLLFETLLAAFAGRGLVKARGKQRTDATHVLAAVRLLNRLELVGETMRHALDALADETPDWLAAHLPAEWVERYGRRFTDWRLPKGQAQRDALAQTIGADGAGLLAALAAPDAPPLPRALPAVETLRQVWAQQYEREGERLRLRPAPELPPAAELIASPHDPEARCAKQRETTWVGYKVQFTETCTAGLPRLITDVQTLPAPTPDREGLAPAQAALSQRALLPTTQLVDAAYTEGAALVRSAQEYQIDLVGPVGADTSWQARAGQGFGAGQFAVNWEERHVTCPAGQHSTRWQERRVDGRRVIKVFFPGSACRECPQRAACTSAATTGRCLTLPAQEVYQALEAARARQQTEAFAHEYAARAGVEGTHTQAVRRCGVRQSRYRGAAKVHLQHLLTACALNFVRVGDYLLGKPPEQARLSRFTQVVAVPT